ncbi:MerR family transcriptional regulator [Dehalobacterium formicoaceticum]|uniref:MerR family transcriptional regulator n=1 Tax=Dehalobacterium formicoaceticum TaxID=51515 RepID=A0ABT1Y9H6_9FIRM|nr:MerR family transcriptional regulator [Dehalobacterium formicoaceticum]MCR6546760.1 MerR family transcriptional regulator [Dehalobacterium formicoaceticum]
MAALTIDQAGNILQVEVSTLRYWEKEFNDFLNINCPKGQRARYTEENIEMFSQIKELLYNEQYTIKGAKRRLEMERTLTSGLGIDSNFKTTVFFMFSAIIQELQKTREESKNLARQLELLRKEKEDIEDKLTEEQQKSLWQVLTRKFSS